MKLNLKSIRDCGIVGAGGAGFPTYEKLGNSVETVILNAAECEPLLCKDKELLRNYPRIILQCLIDIVALVGAREGIIALKKKHVSLFDILQPFIKSPITLFSLDDFYPAGDEIILTNLITEKIVPTGKIPIDIGVMVLNVETVFNIAMGNAVTHTMLTVAGDIDSPMTLSVPIGTSLNDLFNSISVGSLDHKAVILGGAMMGNLVTDLDRAVTKTTAGIIVLPKDHPLIIKYKRKMMTKKNIGSSCCDQCSLCTDLCPRFLIGHPIQPHLAMRALQMPDQFHELNIGSHYCCECNLCSMMVCPIDLDPQSICTDYKHKYKPNRPLDEPIAKKHPLIHERRISLERLVRRLGLSMFNKEAPFHRIDLMISRVVIPLQQHIGYPAQPCVRIGEKISIGEKIADVKFSELGVPIHASIDGYIKNINDKEIELTSKYDA